MPDSHVQVPPDSTGPRLRTYKRGTGANDPHDPYVIPTSDRIVSNRGLTSTFRMVGRANTSRPMFSISLAASPTPSGLLIAVRRMVIQTDSTAARASVMMQFKTYRAATSAISGGTTLTKGQFDTADSLNADIVVRCDASADGTNSATPLAFSAVGALLWQQFSHRLHTAVGESLALDNPLLPALCETDPIILRAGEALAVRMESSAADANTDHYWINCMWEAFTKP